MTCEPLQVPSPQPGRSLPRPSPQRVAPPSRGRALLEEHFALVQKRLDQVTRNCGLPEHEADEFRSWALFRLVENDYRIPGSWEGRSSFSSYLTVALMNLMRDYRIKVWGRWRPSATARRQGREAILLERFWSRDGLPLHEAVDRVRAEPGVSLSRAELERIADELPCRAERRWSGEKDLQRIGIDGGVEERVEESERARLAAHLREELLSHLRALPAEDRLLLKLHYRDGLSLPAVGAFQGRPQRQMYLVRDRCLKKLRQAFEAAGLRPEQVLGLVGSPIHELGEVWEE